MGCRVYWSQTMNETTPSVSLVPEERIASKVLLVRGIKVMLDRDLAELYAVRSIALRQQVKRNQERFPSDFMFQLNASEADILVSQNVIPSKKSLGGSLPFAFTEQGVAMLSSVLRSKRAVQVNIQIIRTFTKLRQILAGNTEIQPKIEKMDDQNQSFYKILGQLLAEEEKPQHRIGFRSGDSD